MICSQCSGNTFQTTQVVVFGRNDSLFFEQMKQQPSSGLMVWMLITSAEMPSASMASVTLIPKTGSSDGNASPGFKTIPPISKGVSSVVKLPLDVQTQIDRPLRSAMAMVAALFGSHRIDNCLTATFSSDQYLPNLW